MQQQLLKQPFDLEQNYREGQSREKAAIEASRIEQLKCKLLEIQLF